MAKSFEMKELYHNNHRLLASQKQQPLPAHKQSNWLILFSKYIIMDLNLLRIFLIRHKFLT